MCAGAIVLARLDRLIFGADDRKAGACGSIFNIPSDPRVNHRPFITKGTLATECGALLTDFFADRRRKCRLGKKNEIGEPKSRSDRPLDSQDDVDANENA
jgi:hypothetical protein